MARQVELDVRHYHAEGREPFGDIMGAVASCEPGDTFVLRNTFEPVPLYAHLERQGFRLLEAVQSAPSDWILSFEKR